MISTIGYWYLMNGKWVELRFNVYTTNTYYTYGVR